jgi:hypothetical protein
MRKVTCKFVNFVLHKRNILKIYSNEKCKCVKLRGLSLVKNSQVENNLFLISLFCLFPLF